MSIIDTFDISTEAIINPLSLNTPIEGFPKVAVVAFGERFITALRENYKTEQITTLYGCLHIPVYHVNFEGRGIAVYGSTIGGPAAVGFMEDMTVKGCEKFLFFGSCGVLDRALAAESLIIPTAAYRDEGTSYYYAPPSDYIEVRTVTKLAKILSDLHLPYTTGKTWTTDAIYRETRGNMEKRKKEGCITVEMECASIMAAAQFRGIEAYQFLYAADNLDEDVWDARVLGGLPQDSPEKFLRIALEAAIRI